MRQAVKNLFRRLLSIASWDEWFNRSWSQEGEDQILRRIFESKPRGFYIDVGAHHPKRFSNTYLFYRKGWSGINIDAMPGSMQLFREWRPRDTNLELGVAKKRGVLDYFVFNEPALNGFSKILSNQRSGNTNNSYYIKKLIKVEVFPLKEILDLYLGCSGGEIDFLTIDVEGLDYEVLQSNDWVKYRPKYVLVEVLENSLHDVSKSKIGKIMNSVGYTIYAKCLNTFFFRENGQQ
jgi:FkbM family methyltransferase